jgi:hypothetical protein
MLWLKMCEEITILGKLMKLFKIKYLSLLVVAALGACASEGPTSNPLVRPFQYFSYMNGDDIRRTCVAGGDSRYRLVYNALYEQQVRTYDIRQPHKSDFGTQETRVFSRGVGANFSFDTDGVNYNSENFSRETLNYDGLIGLDKALISAGFEAQAEDGLVLHSDEFYWVAMVCREGAFKYYAWTKENADLKELPFLDALSVADGTDIKPPLLREPIVHNRGGRPTNSGDLSSGSYFSLQLGDNGLRL